MRDTRGRFVAIVILTVIFLYVIAPIPNKPKIPLLEDAKLNLGIDLAGGAELTYRVLYNPGESKKAELTKNATDVLRKRVEAKKLKEPRINARGDDQIVIQLAGVDRAGLEDYKRLIEQAGKLELYAVGGREVHEEYRKTGRVPIGCKEWPRGKESLSGGDYDYLSGDKILLEEKSVIEGSDVETASHGQKPTLESGIQWVVNFELKADGSKKFDEAAARLHRQNPKGLIAIMLDGEIISAPRIQSDSFGGQGIISGRFDENSARDLAIVLRSGSLPAPIGSWGPNGERIPRKAEAETFVGPTLGQDAIRRGLWASALTFAAVALFMILYYRTSGFIAVISLILNLVYLIGIMAFFNATLTLPGIAGIALTLGMAVDANILIYERMREEQAKGKTAAQAFEAGHERAASAIIDSNVTTLLAGIVLYYFGTGPVQGFAITLSVGILTTLFSVLFCSRVFLKMLVAGGIQQFKMGHLFSSPNIDFVKWAKFSATASLLGAVAFFAFFLWRGEKNFGIDFRGGSILTFGMNEPMDIDIVRGRIAKIPGKDGLPKFPDAEVQTVADHGAQSAKAMLGSRTSRTFQVRSSYEDVNDLKDEIQKVFADDLSHEPFEEMKASDVDPNPRRLGGNPGGPGWFLHLRGGTPPLDEIRKKVAEALKDMLPQDAQKQPLMLLEEVAAPKGSRKLKLTLPKQDAESQASDLRRRVREALTAALNKELSPDPFTGQGKIGPAVAGQLRNSTIWALLVSWVLMIVYLAIRFDSWRYGVAAVIALIHDSFIAIGVTSLAGFIVPKSWGLSFEMNMTTLAAILTVVGYSVNDTIVIFDRIRENLILMKKNTFMEIINASVNQTLSRTILTSFTVWITSVVLYLFTATTGGGIAEFAFPMIIGVIVGTYSTVYIAAPVVLWWYRGQKPATS